MVQLECEKRESALKHAREMWAKACAHDGIDPATKFAVFSDGNPWRDLVEKANLEYVSAAFPGCMVMDGE